MVRTRYSGKRASAPRNLKARTSNLLLRFLRFIPLFLLVLLCRQHAAAYAVITHEQLIDLTWQDSIVPLLLSRYPNLTPRSLSRPALTPTAAA